MYALKHIRTANLLKIEKRVANLLLTHTSKVFDLVICWMHLLPQMPGPVINAHIHITHAGI